MSGGGAKLFVLQNGREDNRICFALPRKFGNAVERNRARRLSREAYRHIRPRLRGGYDLVLLVYAGKDGNRGLPPGAENLAARKKQLTGLFTKAAIWRESSRSQNPAGISREAVSKYQILKPQP